MRRSCSSSTAGTCLRLSRSIFVLLVSVSLLPVSLCLSWVLVSPGLLVLATDFSDRFTIFKRPFRYVSPHLFFYFAVLFLKK